MNPRAYKMGLVGVGMFGGDVHIKTYADLQTCGIAPYLGRIGMDKLARNLAQAPFELVAIASRSPESAERASQEFAARTGGVKPAVFSGEKPWIEMLRSENLDGLAIATPDDLHASPALAALERDIDVILEKPMCLRMEEADQLVGLARRRGRVLGLDMHKRYDPDHLHIFGALKDRLGEPLYARAVLEEPLHVSTQTFKWAERSDPFSYVGVHWTDLFIHYLKVKPRSVWSNGQTVKLKREFGINAFDAVQTSVVFDSGLTVLFTNSWIHPNEFEGPVNQESEIMCVGGKVESDTQYRGLRFHLHGAGTRTANTHFMREVLRPDGTRVAIGYGKDSLIACLVASMRRRLLGATMEEIAGTYPDGEEGRLSVAIIHAAREVMRSNAALSGSGLGAPATASLGPEGITLHEGSGEQRCVYSGNVDALID